MSARWFLEAVYPFEREKLNNNSCSLNDSFRVLVYCANIEHLFMTILFENYTHSNILVDKTST